MYIEFNVDSLSRVLGVPGDVISIGAHPSEEGEISYVDHSGCSENPREVLAEKNVFSKGIYDVTRAKTQGTSICQKIPCEKTEKMASELENLI